METKELKHSRPAEIGATQSEIARIRQEFARRKLVIPEDHYSIMAPTNFFRLSERNRKLSRIIKNTGYLSIADLEILEIGCGSRPWLIDFQWLGAQTNKLYGIDLCDEHIRKAETCLQGADLRIGNAAELPWSNQRFDFVIQSTVFTSILSPVMKQAVANEMTRVLKPNGIIFWYDFRFNNPQNPNVRSVKEKEISNLFPGCEVRLEKITLAPPIARRLVRVSWIICLVIEKIPFLRTHYLGTIQFKL